VASSSARRHPPQGLELGVGDAEVGSHELHRATANRNWNWRYIRWRVHRSALESIAQLSAFHAHRGFVSPIAAAAPARVGARHRANLRAAAGHASHGGCVLNFTTTRAKMPAG
jgi:hypothetical protein